MQSSFLLLLLPCLVRLHAACQFTVFMCLNGGHGRRLHHASSLGGNFESRVIFGRRSQGPVVFLFYVEMYQNARETHFRSVDLVNGHSPTFVNCFRTRFLVSIPEEEVWRVVNGIPAHAPPHAGLLVRRRHHRYCHSSLIIFAWLLTPVESSPSFALFLFQRVGESTIPKTWGSTQIETLLVW
jgi:hypothetical protein